MNAVLTGASKGIGKATADLFLENGVNVAICARNKANLKALANDLALKYPKREILTYACDLGIKSEAIEFTDFIKSKWNEVNILVNNVGVYFPGEVHNEADGVLEQMMNTNVYSAYHVTRGLIPTILKSKPAHIINVCSIASIIAYPNGGAYSISKFALYGFSKVLREEMKDKGVKVVSVLPGATWSNSWEGAELPEDRIMQASDIAKTIWTTTQLSDSAVVEEVIVRPQLGDL